MRAVSRHTSKSNLEIHLGVAYWEILDIPRISYARLWCFCQRLRFNFLWPKAIGQRKGNRIKA